MLEGDQNRPSTCEGNHDGMSTLAGIDVQQQLETLIQSFRTGDPPMPVVVLHSEDGSEDGVQDGRVARLVDQLRKGQRHHGTRYAVALGGADDAGVRGAGAGAGAGDDSTGPGGGGDSPRERAVHLLRHLGDPRRWGERSKGYRRYSFPRLNLVRAIHDAVEADEMRAYWSPEPADEPPGTADRPPGPRTRAGAQEQLLRLLAKQHWRPRPPSGGRSWLLSPAMQQIVFTGLLGGLSALLTRDEPYLFASAGIVLVFVLLALLNQVPGRAPLLLWLRAESRWFLTTTFLRTGMRRQPTDVRLTHPVRSWRAIAARAFDVAEELRNGGEFPLQLYVVALLEDLRDNHRRWSWDLRGFKRPRPPMLFLRRIDEENGGIELIKAVSDVRSRRSEIDPLLIVAGVAAADVPLLEHSIVRDPGSDRDRGERLHRRLSRWYVEWVGNLRSGQSPSHEQTLPWVLKIPLPADDLTELREHEWRCVRARSSVPVARALWSMYSLTAVLALLGATGASQYHKHYGTHCPTGLLSVNRYSTLVGPSKEESQCIGVATEGFRFSEGAPESKAQKRLKKLEEDIDASNLDVVENHSESYVTIIYAGPLSPIYTKTSSPIKGYEELRGVHITQRAINEGNSPVKLRVLPANGGVDMQKQKVLAKHITAYAHRHPSVVGVVGFGRNLETSDAVAERLRDAGLPVVSGTNSSTYLPTRYMNWFSLAATDQRQAEQLGLIAEQLRETEKHAVVLARATRDQDRYTREQAGFGRKMLLEKGFKLQQKKGWLKFDVTEHGEPQMQTAVNEICVENGPTVIYFAGRVEHLTQLTTLLRGESHCAKRKMAILTGDDLSKAPDMANGHRLGSQFTLYAAGLIALEESAGNTPFYVVAGEYLGKETKPGTFVSGQTPLAYDATRVLYRAASSAKFSRSSNDEPHSRAATAANLWRVAASDMATGVIDFTTAKPFGHRTGHSIKLTEIQDKKPPKPLLARPAGSKEKLTCADIEFPAAGKSS